MVATNPGMAVSVVIPQDIVYLVIAAVGDDKHLLKNCALVSSSFLLPSRKQLFSEIYISNNRAAQRLFQVLVKNPVVQSFVRSIKIAIEQHTESSLLLAILRLSFCCPEHFSIIMCYMWEPWNWNAFSTELKDTFSNIVRSPNLFLDIAHLTKLTLNSVYFNVKQSSSLTLAASKGPVIDQCVWSLWLTERGETFPTSPFFSLIRDMEGFDEQMSLPFMGRLRFLEININVFSATTSDFADLSFLMRSFCINFTFLATLKHLKFSMRLCDNYYAFCENLRDADVWNHLDSIITHPTGSRLQRVDIEIVYRCNGDVTTKPENDVILEAVLDGLPLLRKKGILFVRVNMGGSTLSS